MGWVGQYLAGYLDPVPLVCRRVAQQMPHLGYLTNWHSAHWVSNSACQIHAVLHCSFRWVSQRSSLGAILGKWRGKRRAETAVNIRGFFQLAKKHRYPSCISPSNISLCVRENYTSRHCLLLRKTSTMLIQRLKLCGAGNNAETSRLTFCLSYMAILVAWNIDKMPMQTLSHAIWVQHYEDKCLSRHTKSRQRPREHIAGEQFCIGQR